MIDADKLKELRDAKTISEEEYLEQKKRLAVKAIQQVDRNNAKNGIIYIVLAFFLGLIGVHNFYAGYWGRALSQLCLTIIAPWFLFVPLIGVNLWVLIEILFVNHGARGILFNGNRKIIWGLRIATILILVIGFSGANLVFDDVAFEEAFVY